ncbi:MAG: histidinol phosphatase [Actinobacteria bacterium]|jgi:histidinol-phosphatase|nr:histidinol phosphatase [Actinomycetota bacterium]
MKYPGDLLGDIELLKELAHASDEISFDRFQAQDLQIETKPDATPVTDADRAVEQKIRTILATSRPSDKIVGEEYGSPDSIAPGERYWVIDPIDGTKNFLRGVPIWATLIGLVYRDEEGSDRVIAGMVSSPALFRRWYAAEGFGAFTEVNGGPAVQISVSHVSSLADASLSFSDLIGWGERKDLYLAFMERAWRVRGIGDFWSHMLVAEGAVDIAAEPSLALWDMAAVAIIVKEAGGRFSDLENNDGPFGKSGVSTNGRLHELFIKALSS